MDFTKRQVTAMGKRICAILIFLIMISGCALNSDVLYLDDRIDKVSRQISVQKSGTDESEQQILKKYASLANRYEELGEQIRAATGRYEEIEHYLKKQESASKSMEAQLEAVNREFAVLSEKVNSIALYTGFTEKKNAAKPSDTSPQNNATGSVEKEIGPEEEYQAAKFQYDNNKLKEAKKMFESLVTKYPDSDNADNAVFWIGEIYYKEQWYQKAILEYQKVIENYPDGNKAPAAYFKQALAFEKLGEKDNSQLIISELLKKFPDSKEAELAKKRE
jgi:tol-pal system protein YbgF